MLVEGLHVLKLRKCIRCINYIIVVVALEVSLSEHHFRSSSSSRLERDYLRLVRDGRGVKRLEVNFPLLVN